jgi:hypothetical protein
MTASMTSREELPEDGLISTNEVFDRVEKMILLADGDRNHSAASALNCNQTMVALHLLRHLKIELDRSLAQSVRKEAVTTINARLEDLAEANALYGKDQRLGAPDKIARNDREISWLKDLRSIICNDNDLSKMETALKAVRLVLIERGVSADSRIVGVIDFALTSAQLGK